MRDGLTTAAGTAALHFLMKPYAAHPQAWIISCYYNPLRFSSRRRNFDIFYRQLENSQTPFLIVECAFGDDEFELDEKNNIIRMRGRDVLWQKERLLNLAERLLPPSAEYIIWLDADVLFANSGWILETVKALRENVICQPFSRCVRLMPGQLSGEAANTEVWESYAYVQNTDPAKAASDNFDVHGHTGFAWAAQRKIFREIGLYDRAVAGTGDHLMAHAAVGEFSHLCIDRAFFNESIKLHFRRWARVFYDVVQGKIGYVKGDLWHLWHGELKNRRYLERTRELSRLNFSPLRDLVLSENDLYEFAPEREDLRVWMKNYFRQRLEDEAIVEENIIDSESAKN